MQGIWKREEDRRACQWQDRPTNSLAPHRWCRFKLSNDPAFAEKLHTIVGLYMAPPGHAVVLIVDESEPRRAPSVRAPRRTQIQALDRTQPGPPLKKGHGAPSCELHATGMTLYDYEHHGTTKPWAVLNVPTG